MVSGLSSPPVIVKTHKRTSTSPGPGSGVSSSTILVEIVPGLSYTIALYFLGMSKVFCVAAAAIFAIDIDVLFLKQCQAELDDSKEEEDLGTR
jgi:hypothetical protein